MATPSPAESAFQQALKTYKEQLTEKELARIEIPTSLDDLAKAGKTLGSGNQKALRLLEAFEAARVHLAPLQGLLQGVCKLSPKGGDLIWASVNFVFDTVKDVHGTFVQVLEFLVSMSEKLQYLGSLESTFGDKPLVKSALEALYVAIVRFWVDAVKYYRTSISKNAFKVALSGSIAKKFECLQSELNKQEARINAVAAAQHYSDDATHWEQAVKYIKAEQGAKFVSWIAAPSFEIDFKRADKKRHTGTCTWILKKEKYLNWKASPGSPGSFLVIYGIPGAGKTILSSFLITDANSQAASQIPRGIVLYHYFKADDDTKNTPLSAMRSLLQQLYDHLIRLGTSTLSSFEQELAARAQRPTMDYDVLWGVFQSTITSHSLAVTLILDAIDECKGAKVFVRELQKLCATEQVRAVATGRKTGIHVDEFAKVAATQVIEMTEDDVKHDIASFVEYKINKIERLQSARDVRLRSNVIAELGKVENHKGMFLWAYLMCKDVKDQMSVRAIWDLLKKLPEGLNEVYAKILRKLSELSPDLRNFSRLVLRWIVASSRPLSFAELEQALRTANPDDELFDDEEDDAYGLRWSRKDIVRVCGSLVSYTGLDDGDMIRVIHLSTRDFLKSSPGGLQLPGGCAEFLVDGLEAGLTLGQACIDFLLSANLRKHPYFKNRNSLCPKQNPTRTDEFESRYPFFDYATIYWPEYFLESLRLSNQSTELTSSMKDRKTQLDRKAEVFLRDNFVVVWFEEYIRQTGTEFTSHTLGRLAQLQIPSAPRLAAWAAQAITLLDSYGRTISRRPQAVHTCFPHFDSNSRAQHVRAFEEIKDVAEVWKCEKSWVHYDPVTDSLFATERVMEVIRLNRQIIGRRMRFRPATDMEEQSPNGQWVVRSAAVKDRGTFVAVTFCPQHLGGNGPENFYRTVCWSLINDPNTRSTNEWAEIAFVDRLEGPECSIFRDPVPNLFWGEGRGSVVSFGENNTLLTPGGIWNILTEQRISRPLAIYGPDPRLNVVNTCFSGDGTRVARVNNQKELEVLDIHGNSILKHSFPAGEVYSEQVIILAFSQSGNKLVIFFKENIGSELKHRRICFNVTENSVMELPMAKVPRIQFPQFSKDERKIVARLQGVLHSDTEEGSHGGSSIVVWTLGSKEAHMAYLFKGFDACMTFSIVPGPGRQEGIVKIITSGGGLVKRDLSQQWGEEEEYKLLKSRVMLAADGKSLGTVTDNGRRFVLTMCSRIHQENPKLLVEVWPLSFDDRLAEETRTLRSSASASLTVSSKGSYLAAKSEVFRIASGASDSCRLLESITLPFDEADEITILGFNEDETGLACVKISEGSIFLVVYGRDGNSSMGQWSLRASHFIGGDGSLDPQAVRVVFHQTNPSLLAFSYWNFEFQNGTWLAEVTEENEMVISQITDEYLADLQFSICGKYIYNVDRNVKRDQIQWPAPDPLPVRLLPAPQPQQMPQHPLVINRDLVYISSPDMFRIRTDDTTGILFLDHKTLDKEGHQYRSRVVCVLPDEFTYFTHGFSLELALIWPLEVDEEEGLGRGPDEDEVKVLLRPLQEVDKMKLILTGIKSGELLEDSDDWFEVDSVV